MGASWEQIGGRGVQQAVAPLFQQRHIPGQGGRVAGHIDDSPGSEPVQCLDGFGQLFAGFGVGKGDAVAHLDLLPLLIMAKGAGLSFISCIVFPPIKRCSRVLFLEVVNLQEKPTNMEVFSYYQNTVAIITPATSQLIMDSTAQRIKIPHVFCL